MNITPRPIDPRRQRAIDLFTAGVPPLEVAKRVGVSQRSIYDWHGRWRRGGVDDLLPRRRTGRPPSHVLTDDEVRRILAVINAGPTEGPRWSLPQVRKVIEEVVRCAVPTKLVRRWIRGPLHLIRLVQVERRGYRHAAGASAWLRGGGWVPAERAPLITEWYWSGRRMALTKAFKHPTRLADLPDPATLLPPRRYISI